MSNSMMRPEHKKKGSEAMRGKVYGHAARRERQLADDRFAERRKHDASEAMMLGVSADFVRRVIPAYLAGAPEARNG